MAKLAKQKKSSGLRRPPQITVALDQDRRVLYINRDLAGTGFADLADESGRHLHTLIHPQCDNECRFDTLLRRAWKNLGTKRESIEWEIDDPIWERHLRLNLSRPPTPADVTVERRRWFALLTITDITETRREYEAVLSSNRELQRKLRQLEGVTQSAAGEPRKAPQTRQVNAGILAAQEKERRRISADLHDSVAQTMGVVKYSVESRIADLKRRHPELELSDFDPVVDQIREAIDDLRKISHNLSPSILNEFGICSAVDMLCNEFASEVPNIDVTCAACIDEVRVPEMIRVAIYRIVQEALNNIGKHANPNNVSVTLRAEESGVSLTIKDDGAGFDPGKVPQTSGKGIGLHSMRERVELTGGRFEIRSVVGEGTTIRSTWEEAALDLLRDEPVLDCEDGDG